MEGKIILLFIGFLIDFVCVLYEIFIIEDKIECFVWMGGIFFIVGNVYELEYDGIVEWNLFWDFEVVVCVWDVKIKIDLVILESIN